MLSQIFFSFDDDYCNEIKQEGKSFFFSQKLFTEGRGKKIFHGRVEQNSNRKFILFFFSFFEENFLFFCV
jgi:hypothetical protein